MPGKKLTGNIIHNPSFYNGFEKIILYYPFQNNFKKLKISHGIYYYGNPQDAGGLGQISFWAVTTDHRSLVTR